METASAGEKLEKVQRKGKNNSSNQYVWSYGNILVKKNLLFNPFFLDLILTIISN